ncbi:MAG: hypothetical protein Gyms2KO_08620 [Gymnodinialimonas sp.]
MGCIFYRRADGQIEMVAVENIPVDGGEVQVIYRDTQLVARFSAVGAPEQEQLAACFADTPVAGEFECETFFTDAPQGALFERTYTTLGDLVGLNIVIAPRVLYDGAVFNMELGRAAPENIRVRLRFPQSDLTLRLESFPGDTSQFGLTNIEDILSVNTALDVPGARMVIEVSANRGSYYEQMEIPPEDLGRRMQFLAALAPLMLVGG